MADGAQDSTLDILRTAADWRRAGKGVALATVVTTWGSSPRPVGSQLVADDQGNFQGSVSGGCVEGAVIGEAQAAIKDGKARLLKFGVTDEQAWDVGLACGGKVEILVAAVNGHEAMLDATLAAAEARKPFAVATDLENGAQALIPDSLGKNELSLAPALRAEADAALKRERSAPVEAAGERVFVNVIAPPRRLAIVGAVHIAQQLVPMAAMAGYEVTVIDPRSAFGSEFRFPGVTLSNDWPDEALAAFKLDARSAVVTLTHDPKLDDPALSAALKSDCFFIGALGSRKTHASRLARLTEQGFGEADLARIHGPVGLSIGAVSPAEIAVSILAQLTQVLHAEKKPAEAGAGKSKDAA
ncbi:MAG TPA: XdhC/CoxI family protein [Alphaproteobacteria bacterium]|jgi:xanthine dehydrogenase accessory factor